MLERILTSFFKKCTSNVFIGILFLLEYHTYLIILINQNIQSSRITSGNM